MPAFRRPGVVVRAVSTTIVAAAIALGGCGSSQPPSQPAENTVGSGADAASNPDDVHCREPRPSADAVCLQDCGPPVVRDDDPPPAWMWLTPDEVTARQMGGCPRCLPADELIATPDGAVAVSTLVAGDIVWSLDDAGARVAVPVLRVGSLRAPSTHALVVAELADGRHVSASAGHPTVAGRMLGALQVGDLLDGAVITSMHRQPYGGQRTWDILPAGSTHAYWANGVLLASTLR